MFDAHLPSANSGIKMGCWGHTVSEQSIRFHNPAGYMWSRGGGHETCGVQNKMNRVSGYGINVNWDGVGKEELP